MSRARRRRQSGPTATVIWWRDIPAQVNCAAGADKAQWILPERFQTAIDRAAMVGEASDTDTYVAQWRQTVDSLPQDQTSDLESAAKTLADDLESTYSRDRVAAIVANGGWEPSEPQGDTQ